MIILKQLRSSLSLVILRKNYKLKKNILLIIRRGELEFAWICPALLQLKKEFKIYIYFLNKESYLNLSSNKFYLKYLKEISNKTIVQTKKYKIFFKILRYFLRIFRLKTKFIDNKIHDPDFLLNQFNVKKFDFILGEYNSKSQWFKSFKNSKIIFFPNSPQIFWNVKQLNKRPLLCDYLLVNSVKEINYWKSRIDTKKIIETGCPQKDTWWDKKFQKFYNFKKISKSKIILFAYNSFFNEMKLKKNKNKLHKNLKFFLNSINNINKDIKILFKLHPNKNNKDFLNTLNQFPKNFWEVRKEPLHYLIKKCDILISMPKSSAYIDGIYGNKPSLLYFDEYFENLRKTGPTAHEKMGIDIKLNKTNLTEMIKEALYNKKSNIWKKQKKIFKKYFLNYDDSSKNVYQFIKNL